MNTQKLMKLGLFSLSAGLLLAACDTNDTGPVENDTAPIEEPIDEDTSGESTDTPADDGATDDSGTNDTATDAPTDNQGPGLENMAFEVTLDDAISTFYETFGSEDINIEEIQLNRDDGRFLYEFEGWDEQSDYELDIDAETGDIVKQEQDEDNDTDGDILELDGLISPEEAMSTALEASGSGYIEEWDLEVEQGTTVYSIDIDDGEDQKVDALTGELVN